MKIKSFLKPNKWKILIFVVLILIFSFIPSLPCKITYFSFGNPEGSSSESWRLCSLLLNDDISESTTEIFGFDTSFPIEILIVVIISYLLACCFGSIKHRKQ